MLITTVLVVAYVYIYRERKRSIPLRKGCPTNAITNTMNIDDHQRQREREKCKKCSKLIESISHKKEARYDCSRKNVFIFSHPRSGTHMTINLFRFGFPSVQVWKMNHISCGNCTLVSSLRQCGVLVHAIRNPLDVVVSMYDHARNAEDERARNLTLNEYVAVSGEDIARGWSVYTKHCKYVPYMIEIDYELTRSSPKIAHWLLTQKLGWSGQWNKTSIPSDDAVSFQGGRINGWDTLESGNLRKYLNISIAEGWRERCPCEKNGKADDGHQCTGGIVTFPNIDQAAL